VIRQQQRIIVLDVGFQIAALKLRSFPASRNAPAETLPRPDHELLATTPDRARGPAAANPVAVAGWAWQNRVHVTSHPVKTADASALQKTLFRWPSRCRPSRSTTHQIFGFEHPFVHASWAWSGCGRGGPSARRTDTFPLARDDVGRALVQPPAHEAKALAGAAFRSCEFQPSLSPGRTVRDSFLGAGII